MFFHNKLLFYIGIEKMKPLSFFISQLHDMLLYSFFAQQKQSRSLLETDEVDEAFNVTENKI